MLPSAIRHSFKDSKILSGHISQQQPQKQLTGIEYKNHNTYDNEMVINHSKIYDLVATCSTKIDMKIVTEYMFLLTHLEVFSLSLPSAFLAVKVGEE